jgi:hypothetical protein
VHSIARILPMEQGGTRSKTQSKSRSPRRPPVVDSGLSLAVIASAVNQLQKDAVRNQPLAADEL